MSLPLLVIMFLFLLKKTTNLPKTVTLIYCQTVTSGAKLFASLFRALTPEVKKSCLIRQYYACHEDEKQRTFESFQAGDTRILITTLTFAMGIDVSDVTKMWCIGDLRMNYCWTTGKGLGDAVAMVETHTCAYLHMAPGKTIKSTGSERYNGMSTRANAYVLFVGPQSTGKSQAIQVGASDPLNAISTAWDNGQFITIGKSTSAGLFSRLAEGNGMMISSVIHNIILKMAKKRWGQCKR